MLSKVLNAQKINEFVMCHYTLEKALAFSPIKFYWGNADYIFVLKGEVVSLNYYPDGILSRFCQDEDKILIEYNEKYKEKIMIGILKEKGGYEFLYNVTENKLLCHLSSIPTNKYKTIFGVGVDIKNNIPTPLRISCSAGAQNIIYCAQDLKELIKDVKEINTKFVVDLWFKDKERDADDWVKEDIKLISPLGIPEYKKEQFSSIVDLVNKVIVITPLDKKVIQPPLLPEPIKELKLSAVLAGCELKSNSKPINVELDLDVRDMGVYKIIYQNGIFEIYTNLTSTTEKDIEQVLGLETFVLICPILDEKEEISRWTGYNGY